MDSKSVHPRPARSPWHAVPGPSLSTRGLRPRPPPSPRWVGRGLCCRGCPAPRPTPHRAQEAASDRGLAPQRHPDQPPWPAHPPELLSPRGPDLLRLCGRHQPHQVPDPVPGGECCLHSLPGLTCLSTPAKGEIRDDRPGCEITCERCPGASPDGDSAAPSASVSVSPRCESDRSAQRRITLFSLFSNVTSFLQAPGDVLTRQSISNKLADRRSRDSTCLSCKWMGRSSRAGPAPPAQVRVPGPEVSAPHQGQHALAAGSPGVRRTHPHMAHGGLTLTGRSGPLG